MREVREETGLVVTPRGLVDVVDVIIPRARTPRYHFVVAIFECRILGGRLSAASDATEARWVALRETPVYDITENARAILMRLRTAQARTKAPRRGPHM